MVLVHRALSRVAVLTPLLPPSVTDDPASGDEDVKVFAGGGGSDDDTKKKGGRPPLFAKEVKWRDLPSWWSRTDCPLLQLPDHVLDRCFALDTGLGLRDYVALAGVNRFFRTQMDDQVFHEICIHHGIATSSEERTLLASDSLFSRNVSEWSTARERKPLRAIPGTHYVPRGERSNWSKAQYDVYRQERDIHLATERLKRYRLGVTASETRAKALGQTEFHPPVKDGNVLRQVIGVVTGRRNGESPAKTGYEGPKEYVSRVEGPKRREMLLLGGRTWTKAGVEALEAKLQGILDAARKPPERDAGDVSDSYDEGSGSERTVNRGKKRKRRAAWVVPPTPEDSDDDDFEWDSSGHKVIHDCWPSEWRTRAAQTIKEGRINKKTAKDSYKVTEAELLCLKHVLVHNPMNSTAPKQLFLTTAVEALAYRAHGGPVAHADYVKKMNERSQKNRATRAAKIERAKEAGTYVYRPKKSTTPVHWNNGSLGRGDGPVPSSSTSGQGVNM